MFANEIRRAVEASPRVKLNEVGAVLWKAWGAGHVTDAEAEELSGLIETRKALPPPAQPAQRRRVGSRPRSPASMERRRSWAAGSRLPPRLAARFTLAEQAVLAVIEAEVRQHGVCGLTVGAIAGKAGVSETTVRNAVREAKALGLVTVEESRRTPFMSHPNRIRIVSKEWTACFRLTGAKPCTPRHYESKSGLAPRRENMLVKSLFRGGQRPADREGATGKAGGSSGA